MGREVSETVREVLEEMRNHGDGFVGETVRTVDLITWAFRIEAALGREQAAWKAEYEQAIKDGKITVYPALARAESPERKAFTREESHALGNAICCLEREAGFHEFLQWVSTRPDATLPKTMRDNAATIRGMIEKERNDAG